MHRLTGKPAEKRVRGKGRQPMSPASARSDPERGERSDLYPFLRKPGIKSPRQPIREIVVTSCPVAGGDLLQKSAASNNRQSPLLCKSARIRRELFPFTLWSERHRFSSAHRRCNIPCARMVDLENILRQLREDLAAVNESILALERLSGRV